MTYGEILESMKEYGQRVDALIGIASKAGHRAGNLGFTKFGTSIVCISVKIETVAQFAYLYELCAVKQADMFAHHRHASGVHSIYWKSAVGEVQFWIGAAEIALIAEADAYLQATGQMETRIPALDLKRSAQEIVGESEPPF